VRRISLLHSRRRSDPDDHHHHIAMASSSSSAAPAVAPMRSHTPPPSPPAPPEPPSAARREALEWFDEFQWQMVVNHGDPCWTPKCPNLTGVVVGAGDAAAQAAARPWLPTPPPSPPEADSTVPSTGGTSPSSPKTAPPQDPGTPPQRTSMIHSMKNAAGSFLQRAATFDKIQLPPAELDIGEGEGSPKEEVPRSGSRESRRSRRERRLSTEKEGSTQLASSNGPAPVADDLPNSAALEMFIKKHSLEADVASELTTLFEDSVRKARMANGTSAPALTYRWDQIHEIIVSNSPGTSLVIVNLPDPPDLGDHYDGATFHTGASLQKQLDYMNYMEGVAENLPRVMYVHGSGQEIINFDSMAV